MSKISDFIARHDKALHFLAGFLLTVAGAWWTPMFAVGAAAGFVKEWYDLRVRGTGWNHVDLMWTGRGWLLGMVVGIMIMGSR